MIILGAVLLFLGGYLLFVAVMKRDFGLGAMGATTALLAVGIFLRVRAAGYLLAVALGIVTAMRAFDAIRAGEIDGRTLFQITLGLLAIWKCLAWAQEQVPASTTPKLKPRPATPAPNPAPAIAPSQPASISPPMVSDSPDAAPAVPAGKFAWVWAVAVGSFIPFGFGVWYFTNRESAPAPKPTPAVAGAESAPKPAPSMKPTTHLTPSQPAPTAKPVAKVEAQSPAPKPATAPSQSHSVAAASTNSATSSPLPWKIPGAVPASIEVRNMKLVPLVVSTNALGWEEVPPVFRERSAQIMALTVPAGVETGAAEYTARSAGYAIIACNFGYQGNNSGGWTDSRWQAGDFATHGWTPIPQSELGGFLTSVDVHRVQVLFWKQVAARETGRIRCNKYYPPYFIVLNRP